MHTTFVYIHGPSFGWMFTEFSCSYFSAVGYYCYIHLGNIWNSTTAMNYSFCENRKEGNTLLVFKMDCRCFKDYRKFLLNARAECDIAYKIKFVKNMQK